MLDRIRYYGIRALSMALNLIGIWIFFATFALFNEYTIPYMSNTIIPEYVRYTTGIAILLAIIAFNYFLFRMHRRFRRYFNLENTWF